jgi:hypothetical protein
MTSLQANVFKWLDFGSPPWTRFELLPSNWQGDRTHMTDFAFIIIDVAGRAVSTPGTQSGHVSNSTGGPRILSRRAVTRLEGACRMCVCARLRPAARFASAEWAAASDGQQHCGGTWRSERILANSTFTNRD